MVHTAIEPYTCTYFRLFCLLL